MAKSFVLQALKIFGLEEMLKLSEVLKVKSTRMKKAAGEELIVWSDEPEKPSATAVPAQESDNVLQFKRQPAEQLQPIPDPQASPGVPQEDGPNFYSSEFMLWQRELSKDAGVPLLKKEAVKGYSRATEMYVVKSPGDQGKEKIRFASTNGVLVNKKQA